MRKLYCFVPNYFHASTWCMYSLLYEAYNPKNLKALKILENNDDVSTYISSGPIDRQRKGENEVRGK